MIGDPPAPTRTGPLATLAWSVYLAVSWTWCIGMFLPSLLVRDAGKLGFVVFIVPNAIGAALVGWVLAGRGRAFFESKRPLILWFTGATIAFHGYWIAWRFSEPIADEPALFAAGVALGASVVLNLIWATGKVRGIPAAFTMLVSLACAIALLSYPTASPTLAGPRADLVGLALVCALGFGLCPYLDITFNKCVIESGRPRAAFTIGFVIFTLVLLGVTGGRVLLPQDPWDLYISEWTLAALAGGHFGAQTAFTVAAHAEAVRTTGATRLWSAPGLWYTLIPGVLGVILGVGVVLLGDATLAGMAAGEVGYRAFLGFYGLVFPAWLILTIGNRPPLSKRTLTALAIVCVGAAPFFTYGFVWLKEVWLIPGVAIVLVGRLFADKPRGSV